MRGNNCLPDCDFFDNAAVALAAANPTRLLIGANYANGGEHHSTSWLTAQRVIAVDKPQFAFWIVWSPNDGSTAAEIQADYDTYFAAFLALCHANGTIPVVLTSIPNGKIATGTDDAARLSINSAVMAAAASDVIAVDMDALLTDGAVPARIQAPYNLDGTHPNPTGAALMESALQSAIQTYLDTH